MPGNNDDNADFFVKLGIYVFGVILGVASKLAKTFQEKGINWKDVLAENLTAYAAAFLVFAYFYYVQKDLTMAMVLAVFVGRSGDDIFEYLKIKIEKFIDKFIDKK